MTPLEQFIILADVALASLLVVLIVTARVPKERSSRLRVPGIVDYLLDKNWNE